MKRLNSGETVRKAYAAMEETLFPTFLMMTDLPQELLLPIRAATETALAYDVVPDRCDILQNGSTLVLRLTETLVARVVQDLDGPRQGMDWFSRENAVARHLAGNGGPVIPMHVDIPPGPHEHLGYPLNFWQYVTSIDEDPEPSLLGEKMQQCHELLRTFSGPLPELATLTESFGVLEKLRERELLPETTLEMLHAHLVKSLEVLGCYPFQPLHGDAHTGNAMNTTLGLLWTDWEDTFSGPAEWDLASIIWNARVLDEDEAKAQAILSGYMRAGGTYDEEALQQSLIGRAAVMCAWYPILYPEPSPKRRMRLKFRLDWLKKMKI